MRATTIILACMATIAMAAPIETPAPENAITAADDVASTDISAVSEEADFNLAEPKGDILVEASLLAAYLMGKRVGRKKQHEEVAKAQMADYEAHRQANEAKNAPEIAVTADIAARSEENDLNLAESKGDFLLPLGLIFWDGKIENDKRKQLQKAQEAQKAEYEAYKAEEKKKAEETKN